MLRTHTQHKTAQCKLPSLAIHWSWIVEVASRRVLLRKTLAVFVWVYECKCVLLFPPQQLCLLVEFSLMPIHTPNSCSSQDLHVPIMRQWQLEQKLTAAGGHASRQQCRRAQPSKIWTFHGNNCLASVDDTQAPVTHGASHASHLWWPNHEFTFRE